MKADVYKPTNLDIEGIKPDPNKLKVSGDGVFATIQGEGMTAGLPAVFLRLHYCNLTCGVPTGWQCDTGYTWDTTSSEFWREPEDWSYQEVLTRIVAAWIGNFDDNQQKRLVITGGEPMIQQRKIVEFLPQLSGWETEIETNGTIMPIPVLWDCQFNCSPKLENSGNSAKRRYKPKVLTAINGLSKSQFKFVVMTSSDLDEVSGIVKECSLDHEKIWIMPEGQTAAEVATHTEEVKPLVEARGWKITLRNQLVWFGPKRRT